MGFWQKVARYRGDQRAGAKGGEGAHQSRRKLHHVHSQCAHDERQLGDRAQRESSKDRMFVHGGASMRRQKPGLQ
jgi:hypothetical protein